MNHTTNYDLNQWELHDRVLMQDFNADNAKIDAALAQHDSTFAAVNAALSKKGNCRMELLTYTGNGAYGSSSPTRITFSARPALFFVISSRAFLTGQGGASKGNRIAYNSGSNTTGMGELTLTWSGNTVSFYETNNANSQLNAQGTLYCVLALYQMG